MAKRRSEKQLTQNNWDDELEKDDVGQFQKADDNEIRSRVIRVAKRRIRPSDELDSGGDSSAAKPASVFSGFSLVSNKSSITEATTEAPSTKPIFSFGSGFSSQPFGSTMVGSSFGGATTTASAAAARTDDNKSSEFVVKLKELNDAVLKCIKGHIESKKACILTPIFQDYDKYVKELEEKDKNAVSSSPAKANNVTTGPAAATPAATPFSFSFSAAKSAAPTETETASVSTNVASTVAAAPTQTASATTGMFSFNNKPTNTFGSSSSSSAGFSFTSGFQASKPTNNDNKGDADKNGDADADESDEPPKVEFKPVVEEESIYSKRCKVFVKEDGNFKDRGTGTLYIKKVKDEKVNEDKIQLFVRADTNLGNILLNFLLMSAAPPKTLKNNVMIVCVPTPDADATKPKSVLIRVKTEDDANELLQEIEKYQ